MADTIDRKLAAILSADVVGYSRLMAEDEAATIRTLRDYRDQIAMRVGQHRGRVVDAPGDNVLAEFPTALDAVRAAVEIQAVLLHQLEREHRVVDVVVWLAANHRLLARASGEIDRHRPLDQGDVVSQGQRARLFEEAAHEGVSLLHRHQLYWLAQLAARDAALPGGADSRVLL